MFAQIVRFRLRDSHRVQPFLGLVEQMKQWLALQPGWMDYQLYLSHGEGIDVLVWRDEASCRAAAKAWADQPWALPMMGEVAEVRDQLFAPQCSPACSL
ncbi:hypothetical protein ACTSKR_16085 [Chitinibacteraceae bacterium HSL-7]